MSRYVYTGRQKEVNGIIVKQIRFLTRELGGWIVGSYCLPHKDDSFIGPDVIVTGFVGGKARVLGQSKVDGTIGGHAMVKNSTVAGIVTGYSVIEDSIICRDALVCAYCEIKGGAIVHSKIKDHVRLNGCISLNANLKGNIRIRGNGIIGPDAAIETQEDVLHVIHHRKEFIIYKTKSGFKLPAYPEELREEFREIGRNYFGEQNICKALG